MSDRDDMRSEIEALRAELARLQGSAASRTDQANSGNAAARALAPAPPDSSGRTGPEGFDWGEVEQLLRDWQANLGDATRDAEGAITQHPIAAVASAFLLGLVVSRLFGGRA
jgi:hypothetical protein